MTRETVIARSRHADACIRTTRPWQSIFFQVIAAKDGLLRCARNDGVRDARSHCQGLLVLFRGNRRIQPGAVRVWGAHAAGGRREAHLTQAGARFGLHVEALVAP